MIKKIFMVMVLTPIVLAALAVTFIFTVLNWPTLIINENTMAAAARHLAPLGITASWGGITSSMRSHGFLDETVEITFDDLCVAARPTVARACFKRVELAGRYRFSALIPTLVSVGPINIEGSEANLHVPATKVKQKGLHGKINITKIKLPYWLRDSKFYPIKVGLTKLDVHRNDTVYSGDIDLSAVPDTQQQLSQIHAKGSVGETPAGRHMTFDFQAHSPAGFVKSIWQLEGKARADLADGTAASIDAKINAPEQDILEHDLHLNFTRKNMTGKALLAGSLSETKFETKLTASLNNLSDILRSVDLPDCDLKLTATKIHGNRGEMNLHCPVDLRFKKFILPSDMSGIYHPPEHVLIDVTGKADTFFMPDMDQMTQGDLLVQVKPTLSRLVKTTGDIKVAFSGVPAQPKENWRVESDLDVDFIIEDFQRLVKVLNTTKWPVPAPFNVLMGSVAFSLEGHLSSLTQLGRFPVKLTTRLYSPKQEINTDSEGYLDLVLARNSTKTGAIELDVKLIDVQLQLPDVAFAAIPRFTPDGRIILKPKPPAEKKKHKAPLDYKVHVATTQNTPVKILSNITPEFIPIFVDMDIENGQFAGQIKIADFPVKLFTREAHLNRLIFTLEEPIEKTIVDGSISMAFPDIKITVLMTGPLESPAITLQSDPSMSQGDIISTLLYGEPLEGIDSDQASSVNSMNAAMADRAMALTSFFLLGSTPIQSIAYNPQNKVFAAKVRLGKKTSLTVGGSEREKYAKVGRRLGKGFRISTGVDKREDNDQPAATAMIEWSKRY